MSYLDGNLLEGEHVVFRTRLHWKLLVGPGVFLLAMLVPPGWLYLQRTWTDWVLIAPALGLIVLLAAIVKNKRVMVKTGVFNTRSVELLLSKIEAIAVNQTLAGRMLGYGNIVVTGSGGTTETFCDIQAPLEFRRAVQSVTDVQAIPFEHASRIPASD